MRTSPVPERVTVAACIGCRAADVPAPCTGACVDRRIELVPLAEHERARREEAGAAARTQGLEAVLRDLADAALPHATLRAAARDALRLGATREDLTPVERLHGWWCEGCGKLEAPRPCVGICIRQQEDFVNGAVHDAVVARARAARARADALEGPARRLAAVAPREGHEAETLAALAEQARRALDTDR